jgi:hypothetical protein
MNNDFELVFGKEGNRSPEQQKVWACILDKILQPSAVEKKNDETARDFALFIYNQVTKSKNGLDTDAGTKYARYR